MKKLLHLFILTVISCKNPVKQPGKVTIPDPTQQKSTNDKKDNSKYFTKQDTLLITTETGDTLKYSKGEFNKIVENHAEFFNKYQSHPDIAYSLYGSPEFKSEVGQDHYYALYAYFLKQKNGLAKYTERRKKLIEIYSKINSLFSRLQYGGTYFGHQYMRILGYAEYSIYLLPKEKNDIEKKYDISKQKALYLQTLRQLIEDESTIDFNTLGNQKTERNKELNLIVDELDKLITDNFYLKRAQEFHYSHYGYY